jgi:DNA-binding transcriptional LysR family regulator
MKKNHIELRHLRYFVAVAEELHFTRAAARLLTSQPSLSQQVRKLEHALGIELFIRNNHSVELTDAGRVFLEHARRVLDDTDHALQAAQRAGHGNLGHLAIGFSMDSTGELLPDILVSYRAQHPQVEVTLHVLRTTEQIDALLDGRIHLGLVAGNREEPKLNVTLLQRHRMLVAMPAGHPLANRRSLRLADLAEERWLSPGPGSSMFFLACAEAGFEPTVARQVTSAQARLALVASGAGLTLTPEWTSHQFSRHIAYRPLHSPELTTDLSVAYHEDRLSPLIEGFVGVAKAAVPVGRVS